MQPDRLPVVRLLATLIPLMMSAALASAADLSASTVAAFDRYVQATENRINAEVASNDRFLWPFSLPPQDRDARLDGLRRGALIIEPLETQRDGRTLTVPNGLVHHWVGLAFLPGTSIDRAVALLQDYDRHAAIYAPRIARSGLRSRDGDTFVFHLRFFMKKVITVVIDSENTATFVRPAADRAYSRIVSTRLAEIEDAGLPSEREKPIGHDGGYLWRLNTYWRFLERDGGTYIQCESLTLTRDVPFALAWIIRPIVTQMPKESLTFTLAKARAALVK
jgi:hypothetical protein